MSPVITSCTPGQGRLETSTRRPERSRRPGSADAAGQWDIPCRECGGPLEMQATPERTSNPRSAYGMPKPGKEMLVTRESADVVSRWVNSNQPGVAVGEYCFCDTCHILSEHQLPVDRSYDEAVVPSLSACPADRLRCVQRNPHRYSRGTACRRKPVDEVLESRRHRLEERPHQQALSGRRSSLPGERRPAIGHHGRSGRGHHDLQLSRSMRAHPLWSSSCMLVASIRDI